MSIPQITMPTSLDAMPSDHLPESSEIVNTATSTAKFPIVGIAASAGGLEAFSQLLSHLPVDTGMAFVLIQHLSSM